MAEKNTESTAVNELIDLVATAKPLPPDPSEDLMFSKPSARKVSAPRMTASVPSMRGAGTVEPLPRHRTPVGTQQGLPAVNQTIKAVPPGVRISTAPPSRAVSIPPLTLDEHDDEDAEVTNPGPATFARPTTQAFGAPIASGSHATQRPSAEQPIASRVTKPTLPPPVPTMRASSPPAPPRPSLQSTSSFSYPIVQPPQIMPAAEPEEDDPIASILEPKPERERSGASASWLEHDIGTHQVQKRADWKIIAGKLIGPMVVLVIAGIFIGGFFAFDGDGGKKRTPKAAEGQKITMPVTSEEAVAPANDEKPEHEADVKADAPITPPNLAAAPDVEAAKVEIAAKVEAAKVEAAKVEPPTAAPTPAPTTTRPTLVDVRIDSNPSGATVMLIDRGKQSFLGTTPMSAAVDVARKYELVFSYEGRATVVEALDPSTQKKVSVKLSRAKGSSPAPVATPAVAAPKKIEKPKAQRASGIDAALDTAVKTEAPKPADKPAAAVGGEGTLMISSKPPCEIIIDNKPTGLTTPQRAIVLPAGAHKITLVNTAEGIKKTVSIQITADKPTKVIQDFMK